MRALIPSPPPLPFPVPDCPRVVPARNPRLRHSSSVCTHTRKQADIQPDDWAAGRPALVSTPSSTCYMPIHALSRVRLVRSIFLLLVMFLYPPLPPLDFLSCTRLSTFLIIPLLLFIELTEKCCALTDSEALITSFATTRRHDDTTEGWGARQA